MKSFKLNGTPVVWRTAAIMLFQCLVHQRTNDERRQQQMVLWGRNHDSCSGSQWAQSPSPT